MKKTIHFSKAFLPCAIFSLVIILSGVVSICTRGINLGIDFKPGSIEEVEIKSAKDVDDVRSSLSGLGGISVKKIGTASDSIYQIRSSEEKMGVAQDSRIDEMLTARFGNINVLKTDYIGSQMSGSIAMQSIVLLIATMALIWIYATVRFHWDFALGAIIALVHDVCIMFTFISWTQLEFSTTVLAAVLTLIGYSINATVVILDRIRYNLPLIEVHNFSELLDKSLSDTLVRSIITTLTTLFAVISLYVFTTGSIKDFALALIVGLISGCYSSIFISSGFIMLIRRNWKPEYGIHHAKPRKITQTATPAR